MATKKYTVPDWGQATIARAAGLDPKKLAVEHEDDRKIIFLQYLPRKTIRVSKKDGSVHTEEEGKYGNRRKSFIGSYERCF